MQIALGLYRLVFEEEEKQATAETIANIVETTKPVIEDDVFPSLEKREKVAALRAIRDASFRNRVLQAYENQCAMCGLNLDFVTAAHIVSVGQGGSDEAKNGIALCPNHHRAFDLGLIGFNEEYRIIINKGQIEILVKQGKENTLRSFLSGLRNELILPHKREERPLPRYISRALEDRGITEKIPLAGLSLARKT